MLRFGSTEIWIYVFACDFGCVECVLTVVLGFCFVGLVLRRLCGWGLALRGVLGVGFLVFFVGWGACSCGDFVV